MFCWMLGRGRSDGSESTIDATARKAIYSEVEALGRYVREMSGNHIMDPRGGRKLVLNRDVLRVVWK